MNHGNVRSEETIVEIANFYHTFISVFSKSNSIPHVDSPTNGLPPSYRILWATVSCQAKPVSVMWECMLAKDIVENNGLIGNDPKWLALISFASSCFYLQIRTLDDEELFAKEVYFSRSMLVRICVFLRNSCMKYCGISMKYTFIKRTGMSEL